MTDMAWVSKTTGELRPFVEGRSPDGYSNETDDLIELPAAMLDGEHEWDPVNRAPRHIADIARSRVWDLVKVTRTAHEIGGCATPVGVVDTTPESQLKIAGAVQMALIAQSFGQPFAIKWTMLDNTQVELDVPAMIGLGLAVGAHVDRCHQIGVALRAEIDVSDDPDAIDIETPWSEIE